MKKILLGALPVILLLISTESSAAWSYTGGIPCNAGCAAAGQKTNCNYIFSEPGMGCSGPGNPATGYQTRIPGLGVCEPCHPGENPITCAASNHGTFTSGNGCTFTDITHPS